MRAALLLATSLLSAVPAAAQTTIGAVIPLSGASATQGEDQRRGIELAVEEINAAGGVLGKPLKVIIEDSGGRPPSALDAAKKLVAVDKVPAVIGEYSSGITLPMAAYLMQEGKIHINVGSSSNEVRQIGPTSFSVIGLEEVSSKFSAADALAMGWKKVVVVGPNNAYGHGMAEGFKEEFEKIGGSVMSTLLYTEGQTSYRRELQQAAQFKPDAFIYSAYGKDAALINRESFELGVNKTPWYAIYFTMCTAGVVVGAILTQVLFAAVPFAKDFFALPSEYVAAMRLTLIGGGLLGFLLLRPQGLVPEKVGSVRG